MEGWVSIHRQIMDHWIYKERKPFSKREAWFDLILLANHCDTTFPLGNEIIEAKRGDVITSEVKLMDRWMWSKTKIRAFLLLLECNQMIIKKADRKKTVITLINYGNFQDSQTIEKPIKNHEETTKRLQKDTINNVNNDNNLNTPNTPTAEDYVQPMNAYRFFEEERFGMITSAIHTRIEKLIALYSETWVIKAMDEAVYHEKRHLPYVAQILEDWKKKGHPEPWTLPREPNGNQQRGNIIQHPANRRTNGKPQIPVAQQTNGQAVNEARLAEILAEAEKLDEKFQINRKEVL